MWHFDHQYNYCHAYCWEEVKHLRITLKCRQRSGAVLDKMGTWFLMIKMHYSSFVVF